MSKNVKFQHRKEVLAFIEFLANPEDGRTQAEWAAEHGLRPETLSRWKRAPEFWEFVWSASLIYVESRLPRLLNLLITQAEKGNTQAARLIFELTGKVGRRLDCTRLHRDFPDTEPSVDEILRELEKVTTLAERRQLAADIRKCINGNQVNSAFDDVYATEVVQVAVA